MANLEAIRKISPVGRVVWGSVHERAKQDYDGKPYAEGEGPIQFGLAVRKDDPGLMDFMGALFQKACTDYQSNPQLVQRIQNEWQSGFQGLSFRFKIKDGDKPEARSGKVNENTVGCFVFTMSTTIPFKCANAQNIEIDPRQVERGYYVDVACSIKANGNVDATAGIYINPNVVRLIAFGEKIIGGISIEDAFAGHAAPTNLPPGASLTPLAPVGGMPGMPPAGQPQQPYQQPGQPQQPYQQPGQPMPGFTGHPQPGGYPPQNAPAPMTGGPVPAQMPNGLPGNTAPVAGYPSNGPGQMPAGFPMGGNQPPQNPPSQTGYPIDPRTGQPVNPNYGFVQG